MQCDFFMFFIIIHNKKEANEFNRYTPTALVLFTSLMYFNLRFSLRRQKKNKLLFFNAIYAPNLTLFALLFDFTRRKNAVFDFSIGYMSVCLRRNACLFLKKLRKTRFAVKTAFFTDIRKSVVSFP